MKRTNSVVWILVLSIAVLASCGGGGGGGAIPSSPSGGITTYTVTYDGNGSTNGSVPIDLTNYEQGQTVTVLGNSGNLVETNYTFAGWNTKADGSGTTYTQGQTFTISTANVILYCQWTANPTYTVSYNGSGNTGGSVPIDSTNYEQGQTVTVLGNTGNLVKTGYTFSGWYVNGYAPLYTQGQTFTMGAANVVMYAGWTANPTYSVTYSGNGSTSGTVPIDSTHYQQGQTVTVLGNTGNLAKTGYTFAGWNTAANGTGTAYSQGSTFIISSASVTLYAQWTVIPPTYTVTYHNNMATSGTVPVDPNKYQQGQTVTVLGNNGYLLNDPLTFENWNTQPDRTGTSHNPGSTFTMGNSNIDLYSQWHCVTYYASSDVTVLNNCSIDFYWAAPALKTPAGDCELVWNGDLETAKVSPWTVTWKTNNSCNEDWCFWVFQSDGNLVFYNGANNPLWASGTNGNYSATLWLTPALNGCGIIIWDSPQAPKANVLFQAP